MEEKINIFLERLKEKQNGIALIRQGLNSEINILQKKINDEELKIWTKGLSPLESWKNELLLLKGKELEELIRYANISLKIIHLQYHIDEKNGFNDSELEVKKHNELKNSIIESVKAAIKQSAETGVIDKSEIERYNNYLISDPEIKLADSIEIHGSNIQSRSKKFKHNELKERLNAFIKEEKLKPGETVSAKKINKFIRQMENEGYSVTSNGIRARLGDMGYSKEK